TQLEPLYHYLMNIETMKKAAQEAESDTREFSADKWFER
ncbi:TIGR02453 family protein, partial [Pectobacterium parmentieri]